VKGTYDESFYAKTSEKPVHCHVPLTQNLPLFNGLSITRIINDFVNEKDLFHTKMAKNNFKKCMYLLNSSMTILSLTLWFLRWESTARLTSGLHGTRFYSPRLFYPLSLIILRVLINITFLSFLFILSLSFSSLSLSLSHFLSVFLLQREN
jgi:hypothetical protein